MFFQQWEVPLGAFYIPFASFNIVFCQPPLMSDIRSKHGNKKCFSVNFLLLKDVIKDYVGVLIISLWKFAEVINNNFMIYSRESSVSFGSSLNYNTQSQDGTQLIHHSTNVQS